MYKKIALFSALLCTLAQFGSELKPWLEIKPSYFFFATSPMNQIYKHGGFEVQGSASIPLRNCLDFYGSIGCRKVSGHALNTGEKTSLTIIPIDIGLKPIHYFREQFYYYFAIGPRFFHLHQHNYSPYVDAKVSGGGVGLFVNTGFNVLCKEHLLLGVFGEYSYEKKKIHPEKLNVFSNGHVQIGGLALGVSLGYAF